MQSILQFLKQPAVSGLGEIPEHFEGEHQIEGGGIDFSSLSIAQDFLKEMPPVVVGKPQVEMAVRNKFDKRAESALKYRITEEEKEVPPQVDEQKGFSLSESIIKEFEGNNKQEESKIDPIVS